MNINKEINEILKLAGVQINESIDENPITDEEKKLFQDIYDNHLNLVNYYASKINRNFPNHDKDKFDDKFYIPYVKGFTRNKESLSPEEYKQFKEAQNQHYIRNRHHPEYWIANTNIENMGASALAEMCADWCAIGTVFGNTPFEWADKVIGTKYHFNENQINYIYEILKAMWGKSPNKINESLYFNDEIYDEWSETYKELKVWKNPTPEWLNNSFAKTEYGSFRFIYNSQSKSLFVWDAGTALHGEIMDILDIDGDIVGTLEANNEVLLWVYISPKETLEDAVRITKEKFGWYLEQLYGSLDNIKWDIND